MNLTCADCGCVFEISDEKYHAIVKAYGTTPKRCLRCKELKANRIARIEEKRRRIASPFFQFLPKDRKREIYREHI